ncbi:MAG: 2-oxo acid dehydrogenase subunit E2 [Actinomycetota bacterium]|nr:2-oxo acid dehydrogenase subunit E2 [Actinomycetota bacterium]
MAIDIRMPEISADVEEADVLSWLVAVGETVQAGDVLLEIETDKSTVEIESPATGVLTEILVGDDTPGVAVGTLLARLDVAEGAEVAPATPASQPKAAGDRADAAAEPAPTPTPEPEPPPTGGPEPAATALARRIAGQQGVELAGVTGSGARGRITRADVEERLDRPAESTGPAPRPAPGRERSPAPPAPLGEGSTRVPLSRMRRTIAARLSESKQTIPHFYLAADCRVDALLEARRQLNETLEGDYKVSVNDFIVRATAVALRLVPAANVSFDGDALIHHGTVDVAVAVATDGGLITPIIRNADRKGLADISTEVRDLAARARAGKLSPKDYQGGSFSVSNLGMYGIDSVYPIVNPPHAGILGVGQGQPMPVVEGGEVVPATVMTCTLAADHRAIDGAVGAEWLATFKRLIESPLEMSL